MSDMQAEEYLKGTTRRLGADPHRLRGVQCLGTTRLQEVILRLDVDDGEKQELVKSTCVRQ